MLIHIKNKGDIKLRLEDKSVKNMWEKYLNSIGESIETTNKTYDSWCFCDNKESADKLADLVCLGIKRGTTSLYELYELENEDIPEEGSYSIVTNWDGIAKCIIKNKKVYILPFKDVDSTLAYIEGEGDKSLEYWRKVHIEFFKRELSNIDKEFNEDMKVVFEEFEVVYI